MLADFTAYTGNFSTVAIQCLEKCPTDNSKFTFTCDRHTFNYTIDGGYSEFPRVLRTPPYRLRHPLWPMTTAQPPEPTMSRSLPGGRRGGVRPTDTVRVPGTRAGRVEGEVRRQSTDSHSAQPGQDVRVSFMPGVCACNSLRAEDMSAPARVNLLPCPQAAAQVPHGVLRSASRGADQGGSRAEEGAAPQYYHISAHFNRSSLWADGP